MHRQGLIFRMSMKPRFWITRTGPRSNRADCHKSIAKRVHHSHCFGIFIKSRRHSYWRSKPNSRNGLRKHRMASGKHPRKPPGEDIRAPHRARHSKHRTMHVIWWKSKQYRFYYIFIYKCCALFRHHTHRC